MSFPVIDLDFEEIHLLISEGVVAGNYSGRASIDSDGTVVSIMLDAFDDHGKPTLADLERKWVGGKEHPSGGAIEHEIGRAVEMSYKWKIYEALCEWRDARHVRDAAE